MIPVLKMRLKLDQFSERIFFGQKCHFFTIEMSHGNMLIVAKLPSEICLISCQLTHPASSMAPQLPICMKNVDVLHDTWRHQSKLTQTVHSRAENRTLCLPTPSTAFQPPCIQPPSQVIKLLHLRKDTVSKLFHPLLVQDCSLHSNAFPFCYKLT